MAPSSESGPLGPQCGACIYSTRGQNFRPFMAKASESGPLVLHSGHWGQYFGAFMTTASESWPLDPCCGAFILREGLTWPLHDYGLRKRTIRPSVRSIYSIRGAVIRAFHDYVLRKRTIRPSVRSIYSIRGAVIWAFHDYGLRKQTIRASVRSIYSTRGQYSLHD